ncbi:hypothetical protein B0H12DRAFT_153155 [Mycena haematopus]|nr:hypothetical protein B0H12DRAFT_153155 [Mycena haematopus]
MWCPMDPISVTTTLITLATCVKDLISLGQSIRRSFEKVKANRKAILALTEDIICTLVKLHELTAGNESNFLAPHLVRALGDLKAEMLYARSLTDRFPAASQKRSLRGLSAHFKTWLRRHDIESAIASLKEHVHKCFLQFTAFSAARTECTVLRIEHAITVQRVENSMKLRRLEGMMAKSLHDTQFANDVMQRTAGTISSLTATQSYLTFLPSLCGALAQISTYLGNRSKSTSSEPIDARGKTKHRFTLRGEPKIKNILIISIQSMIFVLWWILVGISGPLCRKVGELPITNLN